MQRKRRMRAFWMVLIGSLVAAAIAVPLWVTASSEEVRFTATLYSDVVRFEASGVMSLRVTIYDLSENELWSSGEVTGPFVDWDRTNVRGERLANGYYLYLAQGWDIAGRLVFSKAGKVALLPGEQVSLMSAPPFNQSPPPAYELPLLDPMGLGDKGIFGTVGIGIDPPQFPLHVYGVGASLTVDSEGVVARYRRYVNSSGGPSVVYTKARGTLGSPAVVQSGDALGGFLFYGYDGSANRQGAGVVAKVDGTPGASDMPGRLEFQTTPDGSSTTVTRMTIKNDGNVGIGTASPGQKLTVAGQIHSTTGGFRFPDGTTQTTAATGGAAGWGLGGNAITVGQFLGTTNNQALDIRVNDLRALRIEPHATSPNLIGGYSGNTVTAGVFGATIGGGGKQGFINQVTGLYGTVGGGLLNTASGEGATVGGGGGNTASGVQATVGGGGGNTASGDWATVGGGGANTASGHRATVGGGVDNTASGHRATVGGGYDNTASGEAATVGGGYLNTASGASATLGGGWSNTASGNWATVGGGYWNTAAGDYSFVVGRRAKNTNTAHDGVFLFADSTDADFTSSAANEFAVRAAGGYRLYSNASLTTGVTMVAGGNSWAVVSDRNVKDNFATVDALQLLDALDGMPVLTWNLQAQPNEVRHIGPVAQDFNESFSYLFGEVESPLHINMMDAVGVSLAAAQGLHALAQEQAQQIDELMAENDELRTRLEALERLVQGLARGSIS